jgi:MFS family permease
MPDSKTTAHTTRLGHRGWSLAAAIAAATGFGVSIGQIVPLLSLLLDSRGVDPTLNGVNAAAAFIGVLVGPLLAPYGVRRFGIRNFLLLCFTLEIALCPLLKLFDSFSAWLILRATGALMGSSIFTASEAWINLLAGDAGRGRIVGLYAGALAAGFGLGPLILTVTGIHGWTPFLTNAAIMAVAALPLFAIGNRSLDFGNEPAGHPLGLVLRAPMILLAVALFGLHETTMMTLLPIWALRLGFNANLAAATLSAVFIGSVALQWPIGLLSDKTTRRFMLRLCGGGGLVGAIAMAIAGSLAPPPLLLVTLGLWGGVASAIYPIALSMAGDRFRGPELVTVNAAIIIAYGLGGLVGPALGGAAMDLWTPDGLPAFFIVLFAAFFIATVAGRLGVHDVGIHEMGIHDSGVHDAGIHDAGVHDVGVHGVGVHDAGIHDSGIHDSGIHDSGTRNP